MGLTQMDGSLYLLCIKSGAAGLKRHIEEVNDLNVFPIPDGDTGENMFRTINGGVASGESVPLTEIGAMACKISEGMLMNARGNSGVILSRFFAGISDGLNGLDSADVKVFGKAFLKGVESAYSSVQTPTEGTILTVAREGSTYANEKLNDESTFESFLGDCLYEMRLSLERTPDLLDVLKEAGVVDSGGAGLIYIIEGLLAAVSGETIEDIELASHESHGNANAAPLDFSKFTEKSVMQFGYCTEFMLRLQEIKVKDIENFSIDPIVKYFESIGGDSIVAFKQGTIVKVHVHTFTPSKVLEFCQQFGEFLTIKIENMTLQHNELSTGAASTWNKNTAVKKKEKKKYGIVTVATGEGMINTLLEVGADYVINGGQSNNPSTEEFLKAFDEVNAEVIFVLPNNSNIILTAQQAAELYTDSKIIVIESKDLGEGYSAITMVNYELESAEAIAEDMKNAMVGVETGSVTTATRDAFMDGVNVTQGCFIGLTRKTILVSSEDALETAMGVLEKLDAKSKDIIICISGCDAPEDERAELQERIASNYPSAEFYEIDGKQEVYRYVFILE